MSFQDRLCPTVTQACGRGFDAYKVGLAMVCQCGAKNYSDKHEDWCEVAIFARKRKRDEIRSAKHAHIELEVA